MVSPLTITFPYMGETYALVTALVWAFAVILFKKSGESFHPIALNLFKNTLALVLLVPTMYILGETICRDAPAAEYALLLVSGALGIGISDTLFFKSLNLLGAGLSAIVDCLYAPFIIGMSMIWLDEQLSIWQFVGVAMIVSAVLTATSKDYSGKLRRRDLWWGIFFGVASMAANGVGIVIVKPLLGRAPLLWVCFFRLIGGMAVLGLVVLFHSGRREILKTLAVRKGWKYAIPGAFLGTYVSLLLWLAGMKFTQASIASALNQTSNIFVFVFAALFLREPINRQRTIGIVLGVAGALLVTFV
ncbi:MAG: DMT family transporter [candidate division Zixibacteria bacterium]|nr:DMT family transporter [candidate division Zixibacteria bacterium]